MEPGAIEIVTVKPCATRPGRYSSDEALNSEDTVKAATLTAAPITMELSAIVTADP